MGAAAKSEHTSTRALDIGRGLSIVGVVYGHAMAPWFMDAGARFSEPAFLQWKFGASFVMTLFFFLSGISWREHRSIPKACRQALTLVLIAWLASVALDVVRCAITLAGFAPALGLDSLDFMRVIHDAVRMALFGDSYAMGALWFLAALAVVRVVAACAVRQGAWAVVATSIVLLAASLSATAFGWRNFYQVDLIGVAFVSFVAGHAARDFWARTALKPFVCAAGALFGGVVLSLTFALNKGCRWDISADCGADWLHGNFGVSMILGQFGNLPLFTITAISGLAFAGGVALLLARYGGAIGEKLEAWGRNSLNLLVVNCISLMLLNPIVVKWVVPRIAADNVFFFAGLLTLTIVLNLTAASLMARPLRVLRSTASHLSAVVLDGAREFGELASVAMRSHRVSQRHE